MTTTSVGDSKPAQPILHEQYDTLAKSIAAMYYSRTPRNIHEDLLQECRIALVNASRKYDPSRGVPFQAFARVLILRAARSFLRVEFRRGFGGMSSKRRIAPPTVRSFEGETQADSVFSDDLIDPSAQLSLLEIECWDNLSRHFSSRQREVLELHIRQGLTHRQVADKMGFSTSRATFLWTQVVTLLRREFWGRTGKYNPDPAAHESVA